MAVVYDHAITGARRTVNLHQPVHAGAETVCAHGCGAWPCKAFSAAFAVITRNSNTQRH